MKNRLLYTIICSLLLFVISCKKDLTLAPLTFTTTNQTNTAELTNQLAGLYSALEAEQLYGWGLWGYFEAGNDESFATNDATGTATQQLTESFRSSSQDASYNNFWKNLYGGIERANVLLSVVNQPVMDSATRANIKGQALFLRAYYFYLLVSNFGDVPYKTQLTSSMGTNFNVPATPSKAIYDSIIQDMTAADSLVQNISRVQTTTMVTQGAVDAILARVCLSAAGYPINGGLPYYQKALTWSGKVIKSGYYSLYTTPHPVFSNMPAYARVFINNMQDNFFDNNTQEDIWDAAFLSNGVGAYASTSYTVTQQLGALMGITCPGSDRSAGQYRAFPTLYNLYGAGDQRRDWVISPYILDSSNNKLYNLGLKITFSQDRVIKPDSIIVNGVKVPHIIYIGNNPKQVYDTIYYGTPATAVIDSVNTLTGSIYHVTITNPGSGYNTPLSTFNVTLTAPSPGVNFKVIYTIDPVTGAISSFNITNNGTGYTTLYDRPIGKWRREFEINQQKNTSYTSCEFPIIRYADVLLMYAEADMQIHGGVANQTDASYFNLIRTRAYGGSTIANLSSLNLTMDSIKAERSRELCFEGVRRNDLKRWGLSNWINTLGNLSNKLSTYNVNSSPSSVNLTASQATFTNFLTNPQKYTLFPIPSTELAVESAIYQNPGW